MFGRLVALIKRWFSKVIPYKDIESAESIDTSLSVDMINALDEWYKMYIGKPPWMDGETVKSLGLPAFISAEIARQIVLEMKWNLTGKKAEDGTEPEMNPRAEYLKTELETGLKELRAKLEHACAAGGMAVRPYPNTETGHIYISWDADWNIYPVAFTNDGKLQDVIFRDTFTQGKNIYTRLERHKLEKGKIEITNRAFKSIYQDALGEEISLSEVPQWAALEPEATVSNTDGQLFGWYKVASANCIDVNAPMGVAVFAKARDLIKEADAQYSRLLWEYEASEMAIDVDPSALKPKKNGNSGYEMPKLNERLFRAVDLALGDNSDLYKVFAPPIRDASLLNGLNQLFMRIEDQCGLARGSISDANLQSRTATELKIVKQRSYVTISDNQAALEACLRDVVRAMDKYATMYNLAPEGEYELSFEWDDSIITDSDQQLNERLTMVNAGIMSKTELRAWYLGETEAQAQAAIDAIQDESYQRAAAQMQMRLQGDEDIMEA